MYSPVLQYEDPLSQPRSCSNIINPTFAILIHWMVSDVLPCDTFSNVPCTISLPICMQQRYLLAAEGTCRHTNWVEQSAPKKHASAHTVFIGKCLRL